MGRPFRIANLQEALTADGRHILPIDAVICVPLRPEINDENLTVSCAGYRYLR
jgi:hypothetical protein